MQLNFSIRTFAALILILASLPTLAAPGDIDTTFNGSMPLIFNDNGLISTVINPLNGDILSAGILQFPTAPSDGNIIVYKPDGTLDTTVGNGSGKIILTAKQAGFTGGSLSFWSAAVDNQGRILATGQVGNSTSYGMILARFKPNGTLDKSFGAAGTGIVTSKLNAGGFGTGLSLTKDGHILVTGLAPNSSATQALLTVWRFNTSGTHDNNFGNNGHVQIPAISDNTVELCFPALQPNGKLLAGCEYTGDGTGPWKIVRLDANGSVDTSFGSSGYVTGNKGKILGSMALTPNGGFIVGELDPSAWPQPLEVRRFLGDGSINNGFNNGSPLDLQTLTGQNAYFFPLVMQPDGKILIEGTGGSNGSILETKRLLGDGSTDTSFGANGISSINFSNINGNAYSTSAFALLMQGDGKIVSSGEVWPVAGGNASAYITRLDNDTFDLTPDAFSFTDQVDVDHNTLITSNAITISGLSNNISVPVTISGGEYKINSGTWTTALGFVKNGDQIAVRQTSSDTYSTKKTTTLSVGGYAIPNNNSAVLGTPTSADFTSTTKTAPANTGSSGSGGGGSFTLFVLFALLLLAFTPWLLHRRSNQLPGQRSRSMP